MTRLLPLLALLFVFFAAPARALPTEDPSKEALGTLRPLATAPAPAQPDLLAATADHWLLFASDSAWARPFGGDSWQPLATPSDFVVAPGASAAALGPDLLVIQGSSANRLALSGAKLARTALPDLPEPRFHAAVLVLDQRLLVIGGRDSAGTARAEVYALDLRSPSPAWSRLEDHPSGPIAGASAAVNFGEAFLLGGNDASSIPQNFAWSYRFRPVDGTTITGWIQRKSPPVPLVEPALVPSGTAHFIALSADGSAPWVFNSVLDAWYPSALPQPTPESGIIAAGTNSSPRLLSRAGDAEFALDLTRAQYGLNWLDYAAIGLYFVAMVWVGLALSGKGETSAQFALGNRDIKGWAAGISMFATGASSISFMAIPALAFSTNLVMFFPIILVFAGYFVSTYLIYPLLRRLEITSTYEYLHRRYNRGLRLIASAQCILFQSVGRMSVILVLPSLAISAFTGLDVAISVVLMGVLTTIYTAIGGFKAVIWTDVFQGVLMIAAPILVIGYAFSGATGDLATSWAALEKYDKFQFAITDWNLALPVVWFLLLGGIYNMVGAVGDQPVIQRVFSVPMREIRKTSLVSAACAIIISALTYGMGLAIFAFYHGRPESFGPANTNDQVVPLFIVQNLPAGICGLVIASIFAAAMSTLSSSMNSVATLVCEDFYKPLFPNSSDASRVRLMKIVSYGVGAIGTGVALFMAKQEITSMFATWNTLVALLGGGFGGIYILGVFTTRTNSIGAIAGGFSSIAATTWVQSVGGIHWAALMPFAITVCLVVGYLVSVLTGGSRKNLAGLTVFTVHERTPASTTAASGETVAASA